MALRVGLVFGGASVEHEVSVVSARGVFAGLEQAGLETIPIAVTRAGHWLTPQVSAGILHSAADAVDAPDGSPRLSIDPGGGQLVEVVDGLPRRLELDAVFCLVHGQGGEDGRFQGALDLAGVPYVGAGVRGSAVAMDKQMTRAIFEACGLPVGPWAYLRRSEWEAEARARMQDVVQRLGLPLFVKPANGGSSVGIRKVGESGELPAAIERAFELDDKVVIEAGIDAREIEVAVLGNADPQASVPGEILPSREFYDYAAKYEDGTSELLIPAPLDSAVAERIRRLAVRAFVELDLAGLARVDFFIDRNNGEIYLNEVNTLPGFTPISMFPKLWEASGVPYPELLKRLVGLALERDRHANGGADA